MNATEHLWFIHEWVWQPFLGQGWFTHVCYKTITFQVMAWWRQAPIHYLSQCWQTLKLLYYMESLSHNELTHWGLGAFQKHLYELLNPRALKISMSYKNRIFQCKDKIFCVEFQRFPLKFHQCRQKTLLVHQTFVWWTLYILYKFGKFPIRHLGLAIGNVWWVRRFLPTLFHTKYLTHTLSHWKMCILFKGENLRALRFKSS